MQADSTATARLRTAWTSVSKASGSSTGMPRRDGILGSFNRAPTIKTAPYPEYMELARQHGFLAECISQAEIQAALQAGFPAGEIVLNGPGKWWPRSTTPSTVSTRSSVIRSRS